ncbi:MAG: aldehyde dehydrogenase, partial [Acidobacteria bacterium]|nr:aldehyde dehydrogenase [Acidobacteriota bacterium]
MTEVRIGINGFGRIGRCAFKHILARPGFRVVGVNDLADRGDLAYLLKYDSVHGWYPRKVEEDERGFVIDGNPIPFFSEKDPGQIPWGEVGADVVIEATGVFRTRDKASAHLAGGAKRVIISAPSEDADGTFVLGVNGDDYDPAKHQVVSMASCTTNCLAPVTKVLQDNIGIKQGLMTTVHAYTNDQVLVDVRHK